MIVALLSCLGICTCMVRVYDDSQMEYLRATNLYIADRATEIPVKITTVDKIMYFMPYANQCIMSLANTISIVISKILL